MTVAAPASDEATKALLARFSALPHLVNALPIFGEGGMPPWRPTLLTSSALAAAAALLVALWARPGPFLTAVAPFHWRQANNITKTLPYLEIAAEQALLNYANREAAGFFGNLSDLRLRRLRASAAAHR